MLSYPVLIVLQRGCRASGYLTDPHLPNAGGTRGNSTWVTSRTSEISHPTTTSPHVGLLPAAQHDARGQAPPPGELGHHRGAGAAPGDHGGHHHRGHGRAALRSAQVWAAVHGQRYSRQLLEEADAGPEEVSLYSNKRKLRQGRHSLEAAVPT